MKALFLALSSFCVTSMANIVFVDQNYPVPLEFETMTYPKQTQTMEYRASGSNLYHTINMPGIAEYQNATFYNAVVDDSSMFFTFLDQVETGSMPKRTICVNADGIQFQYEHAWVTKIMPGGLTNDGNAVKIDSLTIAYGGIIMTKS